MCAAGFSCGVALVVTAVGYWVWVLVGVVIAAWEMVVAWQIAAEMMGRRTWQR